MQRVQVGFILLSIHVSMFGMMRAPRINLAPYVPKNLSFMSVPLPESQIVPVVHVRPELLKKIQAEVLAEEQSIRVLQEEMMPIPRYSATSGVFNVTRRNLFKATPGLYLLSGQERNRLWVSVNQDIENYKRLCGFPEIAEEDLIKLEKVLDERYMNLFKENPSMLSTIDQQRQIKVMQEITYLFEFHGLNPDQIPVYFLSKKGMDDLGWRDSYVAGVVGSTLLINEKVLQYSMPKVTATIEHEIGHIISHDSAYLTILKLEQMHPYVLEKYNYLIEKRADIHSGIQSQDNVNALRCVVGYAPILKIREIKEYCASRVPQLFKLPEMVELEKHVNLQTISAMARLDMFVEGFKKLAYQQHKLQKLKDDELQALLKICDTPTYLDDLLMYHLDQK